MLDWDDMTEHEWARAKRLMHEGWTEEGIRVQLKLADKPTKRSEMSFTLKKWEEKYSQDGIKLKNGNIAIKVGEDRSDPRRLDALRITDCDVKFFRGKWATLEKEFHYSYNNGEWYG